MSFLSSVALLRGFESAGPVDIAFTDYCVVYRILEPILAATLKHSDTPEYRVAKAAAALNKKLKRPVTVREIAEEPYLRVLIVLVLESGLRCHKEALCLRWDAIDFTNNVITVLESKTPTGRRKIPLSARCKTELLNWRKQLGADYSPFVFPNFRDPSQPAKDIRKAWAKALKDAGIEYFWLYNLRHSYASRLSAAGVADLFVAQLIGHSSPGILQRYSKAIDEYRRDAIRKLEQMRETYMQRNMTNSKAD